MYSLLMTFFNFFKAEGVKIFILLYKEFQLALGLNSYYTKQALMCDNIKVHNNLQIPRYDFHSFIIFSLLLLDNATPR